MSPQDKAPVTASGTLTRRLAPPSGPKLNIATPAYGSRYAGAYVRSLYSLLMSSATTGVRFSFSDIDYADVVTARNYLITNFYFKKPDCSHLLFLDDDMGFDAGLIHAMIALGEPVVGAIYPRRAIDLKKLHSLGGLDFEKAYAQACSFIGEPGAHLHPKDLRFAKVQRCGTGILLISREAVRRMIEACPDIVDNLRFRKLSFGSKFEQFLTPFDKVKLDDAELSEDFSFCHRWTTECKGSIYASIGADIEHVGELTVKAKFSDR